MFHKSFLSNRLSVLIRKQPPKAFCQGGVLGDYMGFAGGGACAGVSIFNRVAGLKLVTLLIGRLQRRCLMKVEVKFCLVSKFPFYILLSNLVS